MITYLVTLAAGLYQPIILIKKNGKNYIHTGHRRYTAIKNIYEKGNTYTFMGKEYDGEIPCIYVNEIYENEIEEKISMMRSNSYRNNLTSKEKEKIVEEAINCFKELEKLGKKPSGRMREWVESVTGISQRTVQNIVSNKKEKDVASCHIKKLIKEIKKLSKNIQDMSIDKKELEKEIKSELNKCIFELMEELMNIK